MPDRILAAINRNNLLITQNPKGATPETLAKLHKTLDMSMEDYARFHEYKSLAGMDGTLTLDEALTVYGYLGETLEHFNSQPLGVKITLTHLYKELLGQHVAVAQAS